MSEGISCQLDAVMQDLADDLNLAVSHVFLIENDRFVSFVSRLQDHAVITEENLLDGGVLIVQ